MIQKLSKNQKLELKIKLNDLYNIQNKSLSEIAQIFGCQLYEIDNALKCFKIPRKRKFNYRIPNIGEKFYRLEFIEEKKYGYVKKWKCKCECGKIKEFYYYSILRGDVKSCGCYNKQRIFETNWKGYEEISRCYINSIIDGAKQRKLEYNLTDEYLWDLFIKQNRKCIYTNLELNFYTSKKNDIQTASLDRIDSKRGYIENNVQWIYKDVNLMKFHLNEKYFLNLCKLIANNMEEKCTSQQ